MFNTPTTFIFGAGASWHYGYPTGEGLVKRVVEKARHMERYFVSAEKTWNAPLPDFIERRIDRTNLLLERSAAWGYMARTAEALAERLERANPTLIDYFLKQSVDLHEIGKLAIAMVLFDCEAAFEDKHGNPNHQAQYDLRVGRGLAQPGNLDLKTFDDDWLRFVLYKLTSRCESSGHLLENDVTFVTFNYDTSLERRLFLGLKSISMFEEQDIRDFFPAVAFSMSTARFVKRSTRIGSRCRRHSYRPTAWSICVARRRRSIFAMRPR